MRAQLLEVGGDSGTRTSEVQRAERGTRQTNKFGDLVHGRNSCEDSNGKINYFQSSADTASGGAERVSS